MNKKTKLTKSIPELMLQWKKYRQGLKGLGKTDWCISSDYCFDNPNKLDVATFTIFPKAHIRTIVQGIKANLPCDIKEMKEVPENTINFLNSKYFFTISIAINDLKYGFDEVEAIRQISTSLKEWDTIPLDTSASYIKDRHRKLNELYGYLQKKSHSK